MEFNEKELIVILPLAWLFLFSLMPLLTKAFRGGRELPPLATLGWCLIGLLGAAGLSLSLVNGFWSLSGTSGFLKVMSDMLIVDGVSIWSSYILFATVGFCLFLLYDHPATKDNLFSEHLFLILNSTIGMGLLVMSNHLILTFVAIELMSLPIYLLIAFSKEKTLAKESAFKYFVLGSLGSAIFLYGLSFIYGATGTLNLQEFGGQAAFLFGSNTLFRFGVVLTVAGLAFKTSLVPFHAWTPDVYQGAATPITTFMATAVKVASFVAFLRFFMYSDFSFLVDGTLLTLLQWLAALTMVGGNVAALVQTNVKRMLAYSGIAHSGYAFVALIAGSFGSSSDGGISSLLFYLFSYTIMTLGTFALVTVYEKSENTVLLVDDLAGLAAKAPGLAASMALLLFSLAGLPPSLGFFGKFYVFAAAVEQGMIWLTVVGVISSVLGLFYYLKPIVSMYMSDGSPIHQNNQAVFSKTMVFVSALCVGGLGLLSSQVFHMVKASVTSSF